MVLGLVGHLLLGYLLGEPRFEEANEPLPYLPSVSVFWPNRMDSRACQLPLEQQRRQTSRSKNVCDDEIRRAQ